MSRKILLFGAGKSASVLIDYFLKHAASESWNLGVADLDPDFLWKRYPNHPALNTFAIQLQDEGSWNHLIQSHDIVVSLLPPHLHIAVAKACIHYKKHLVTASYVSPEMQELDAAAENAGVCLMNECGLDPGIDHMSAMQLMDGIRRQGGKINHFLSYAGGLVAPESDNNPWNYKFTWNPRNVILAGKGGLAKYRANDEFRYISYSQLFKQTKYFSLEGWGDFVGYANRDSLAYREKYRLNHAHTIVRGTLRRKGYCKAWSVFVELGMTNDETSIEYSQPPDGETFFKSFLSGTGTARERLIDQKQLDVDEDVLTKMEYLCLFDSSFTFKRKIGTPADFLLELLEIKWKLDPEDHDMIVMLHDISYELNNETHRVQSNLVVTGEDHIHTAMAKTVGLPAAITCKTLLNGNLGLSGVQIPIIPEFYQPVLEELKTFGINFQEKHDG